jgi:hypothetical protein
MVFFCTRRKSGGIHKNVQNHKLKANLNTVGLVYVLLILEIGTFMGFIEILTIMGGILAIFRLILELELIPQKSALAASFCRLESANLGNGFNRGNR